MKFLILRKLHGEMYGLYRANKHGAIAFLRRKDLIQLREDINSLLEEK